MKLKICLMGLLCLFFLKASTQQSSKIHPLKVGDIVPNIMIKNILNYNKTEIKISDFRGKLVILDFWSSWCSTCLGHFAAADSIQKVFPHDIQILLVNCKSTKDTKDRVITVLNRFKDFTLPTAIDDTVLFQLFTHFSLPHYVWIDKAGVVRATTSGDELTTENVRRFLKFGEVPVFQKTDFDPQRPLYTVKDLPVDHLQQYSILLKGKIDGIGGGGIRMINDTARGVILHNRSLLWMYQSVLTDKIPGFNDNRLILNVKDSAKLLYVDNGRTKDEWERDNFYNYELIVPTAQLKNIYDYVLEDLNRYTPFIGSFEIQHVNCWILTKAKSGAITPSKGGDYINSLGSSNSKLANGGMLDLCIFINTITGNAVVLDETGYHGNLDLNFDGSVTDPLVLQEKLKTYGLKLFKTVREVQMLVVRDKQSNL